MSKVEAKLADLGLTLPPVAAPVAAYVPALRSGEFVFTSGQLPVVGGKLPSTGKVGAEVSPEEAKEARADLRAERAGRDQVGDR